jgi:hypothetical protein
VGYLLGIGLFIGIVSGAGSDETDLGTSLVGVATLAVVGVAFAMLAPRTTGIAATAGVAGTVTACVICAFRGQGTSLLVNAAGGIGLTAVTVAAGWRLRRNAEQALGWQRQPMEAAGAYPWPLPSSAPTATALRSDTALDSRPGRSAADTFSGPSPTRMTLDPAPPGEYMPLHRPSTSRVRMLNPVWLQHQMAHPHELRLFPDAINAAIGELWDQAPTEHAARTLTNELMSRTSRHDDMALTELVYDAVWTGIALGYLESGSGRLVAGASHPSVWNMLSILGMETDATDDGDGDDDDGDSDEGAVEVVRGQGALFEVAEPVDAPVDERQLLTLAREGGYFSFRNPQMAPSAVFCDVHFDAD